MYTCEACNHESQSLRAYSLHLQFHRNIGHFEFPCKHTDCNRRFKTYSSFKSHCSRDHSRSKQFQSQLSSDGISLLCNVSTCTLNCANLQNLLSHLREHLSNNEDIQCPFSGCCKIFVKKSSFSSHLSRCHKNYSVSQVASTFIPAVPFADEGVFNGDVAADSYEECDDDSDSEVSSDLVEVDKGEFVNSLALFYLKLQAKYILPASTIQTIIDETQVIHNLSQSFLSRKLRNILTAHDLSKKVVDEIDQELFQNDLLTVCNGELLKSDNKRTSYFKNNFNYVSPVEIYLGKDQFGRHRYCQYIPVKEAIITLFKDRSVQKQYEEVRKQTQLPHILEDITDGCAFKSNQLFQTEPGTLRIILYQDSFEIVNPLGSGKKKHKILAVYFTLADLHPHSRSNIDHMQLVLLCREVDFNSFGQEKVFSKLISDLQYLEKEGLFLGTNEHAVKGTVCCIAGDNLGSHCIGGFTENFSTSEHFCRYCLISREQFHSLPYIIGPQRTVENYEQAVTHIKNHEVYIYEGVKFSSIFNKLEHYHVSQPGLPPCLGHDLFEGVVSYDLAIYIQYFVKVKKWFTYIQLNRILTQFKFLGSDANNKPNVVNVKGERLGGHAVQNWCLLRLLPILIGDRILDHEDDTWQLCLQLRSIVDIVCAPKVTRGLVSYLRVCIDDYIEIRQKQFPQSNLKPKHHFLAHYPELILQFGPLMRVWTLRFESKHTYFKQCARKLQNFINPCKTLAERHQLLQAYYSAGSLFPPCVQFEKGVQFHFDTFSAEIQRATEGFHFSPKSSSVTYNVTLKGTQYKKGQYVVISRNEDYTNFGKIILIIVSNGTDVHFVTQNYSSFFLIELGLFQLNNSCDKMYCTHSSELSDYYPLPSYKVNGKILISLHHTVCDDE